MSSTGPGQRIWSPMPHIQIPPGAQPPSQRTPTFTWATEHGIPVPQPPPMRSSDEEWQSRSPLTPRPRSYHDTSTFDFQNARMSPVQEQQHHDLLRTTSASAYPAGPSRGPWGFPEPHIPQRMSSRSLAARATYQNHRASFSEGDFEAQHLRSPSMDSLAWSEFEPPTPADSSPPTSLSHELSNLSLSWEENLERFQAGNLPANDQEWHRMVTPEALEALPKKEVQRQSVIFELIKSEKDYVDDLKILRDAFITPLENSTVMPSPQYFRGFCKEVFYNLDEIRRHHERMLGALFERQREQHPLIQSVADIILDSALRFRDGYESYIKHYPLSEAQHRRELRRNPKYHTFLQSCFRDPVTRKRDLIIFISRPVTRLPRLMLMLEQIEKLTEPDHPDIEQLPVILDILRDFVRSTEPGIAAAESKVKFWALVESVELRSGEIIDMDVYNENRTLNLQTQLSRRQRSETDWHGWHDYEVALLDNYLLLTKKDVRKDRTKYIVASRPIPLEYIRLGSFTAPSESRKVKSSEGGALSALTFKFENYYPFTIFHASAKLNRRYTLYATSDKLRAKWEEALVDAIGLRKAQQEANQHFVLETLNDGFFRTRSSRTAVNSRVLGRIHCAASFKSGSRGYIVAGTSDGLYVSPRGEAGFKKVLRLNEPSRISILQRFNKLIVLCEMGLLAYSLDLLARASQSGSNSELLEASVERIAAKEDSVQIFRIGVIAERMLVVYTTKSFRQTNIHAVEVLTPETHALTNAHRRTTSGDHRSFRSFGSPFYVPKDASDITMLKKTLAISNEKGLTIVDPTHLAQGHITTIPDFSNAPTDINVAGLKARCETAKSLGIVQSGDSELLIVYHEFGVYVTKHGAPARNCQLLRWETPAVSFVARKGVMMLLSADFIEVREVKSGRLLQVIEGKEFRLVQSPVEMSEPVLIAMRGTKDDDDGMSDALMEVIETAQLSANGASDSIVWDEWD